MSTSLSKEDIEEVLKWVDSIPLSRKRKNISRDFSDAVLMAEIVAHFYPKLVDLFNYDQGLKIDTKIYNWKTLNTKVLQKLEFHVDNEIINDLANSKPGVIEKLLFDFKNTLEQRKKKEKKRIFDNISFDPDFQEIESAQTVTDRQVLLDKIKECEKQSEYINELTNKINHIEELIKAKDERLLALNTRKYAK